MPDRYVEIPRGLNLQMLRDKFGYDAVEFYTNRIKQRELEGKTYYNPLKTVYIWATEDRAKGQGFYSSYRGYSRGHKNKNMTFYLVSVHDPEEGRDKKIVIRAPECWESEVTVQVRRKT